MSKMIASVVFACFVAAITQAAPTQYEFIALDEPDDGSSRSLNGFSKTFDDGEAERFCERHQRQYARYCEGFQRIDLAIRTRFCPKYEKLCTGFAAKYFNDAPADTNVPLVIPPPLPSSVQNPSVEFDLPIPTESRHLMMPIRAPVARHQGGLTPEMISMCTADCRLPHCTTECKCIHSHPTVHAMCNPPPTGDLVDVCNRWYQKCPMFKPVHY